MCVTSVMEVVVVVSVSVSVSVSVVVVVAGALGVYTVELTAARPQTTAPSKIR